MRLLKVLPVEISLIDTNVIIQNMAAEKLSGIVSFMGVTMPDKLLVLSCLEILQAEKIDLVDAYLLALSKKKKLKGIFSFDKDLSKRGLKALAVQ